MRITGIHAENFLSFPPGSAERGASPSHAFQLDDLDAALTIVVGPNGSGKSNAIKVVQLLLDSLRDSNEPHVFREPEAMFHRPGGHNLPIELACDIVFDDPHEREVLHTLWSCALAYPSERGLQGLDKIRTADGGERFNTVTPQAKAMFTEWIIQQASIHDTPFLYYGRLVRSFDLESPRRSVVQFHFVGTEPTMVLDLDPGGYGGTVWFPAIATPTSSPTPLVHAALGVLTPEVRQELAVFLEGSEHLLPPLPVEVCTTPPVVGYRVEPSGMQTDIAEQFYDEVPVSVKRLRRLLGQDPYRNERLNLAVVIRQLIRNAVVWIDEWSVPDQETLMAERRSTSDLLSKRKLSSYLLSLQHGSEEDTALYEEIRRTFHDLSGADLKVRLWQVDGETHHRSRTGRLGQRRISRPPHFVTSVETRHEISLARSGSGRAQTLLVSALICQHKGTVLLLDEPDQHIHPPLQSQMSARFLSGGAQHLVVTHSPYMIPAGGYEYVRRLRLEGDPPGSVASEPFAPEEIEEMALRSRGRSPDQRMFLFAKCVAFVEGPNDANALAAWFDRWAEASGKGSDASERLGLRFQDCGGKLGVAPMMVLARRFGVPRVGLYDADVLARLLQARREQGANVSKERAKKRNEAMTLRAQWQERGLVMMDVIDGPLDNTTIERFPACAHGQIFLIGNALNDDLEKLTVFEDHMEEAIAAVGDGPLAFRYIAQRYDPEGYEGSLNRLFQSLYEMC